MRAFAVRLPSGQRYWTVLDGDLQVVAVADAFLRHQRFGRDGAESTTKAYAHQRRNSAIACAYAFVVDSAPSRPNR